MKPERRGDGGARAAEGHPADPALVGGNGDCVSATDLLVELAQCQRSIRSLIRAAISGLVPVSNRTLPAVAFTLGGLIHATEMAANKVLDHAEGLASERERLGKALARVEPLLDTSNPTAKRAWLDVMECNQALTGRVMSIMSGMAFQDLTTQQLTSAIKSVDETRHQLSQILVLLDLPVEMEEPDGEGADRCGPRPSFQVESRQGLADRLWAEMKQR